MACDDGVERIQARLTGSLCETGQLSATQTRKLEAHLKSCERCRSESQRLDETFALFSGSRCRLARIGKPPSTRVWSGFKNRFEFGVKPSEPRTRVL